MAAEFEAYVPGQLSLGLNPSAPPPKDVGAAAKLTDPQKKAHKRQRKETSAAVATPAKQKKRKKSRATSGEEKEPASAISGDDVEEKDESPQGKREREQRTLFVGNVPISAQQKQLTKLFATYGPVESVRFRSIAFSDPTLPRQAAWAQKKFHEKRDVMNAYVVFKSTADAQKALVANGTVFMDKHLRVDAAVKEKPDNSRSVFIGNMPYDTAEEDVRSFFESCGQVSNVRLIRDRASNVGKGFGYVLFESAESVEKALAFHGSVFNTRELRVFRATDQTQPKKGATFAANRLWKKKVVPGKKGRGEPRPAAIVPFASFRGEKANAKSTKMHKRDRPSKSPAARAKSKSKLASKGKKASSKGGMAKKAKKAADKKAKQTTQKNKAT